jgi:SAM-dependent methyltransferase
VHESAARIGKLFFDTYSENFIKNSSIKSIVLEVGCGPDETLKNKSLEMGFEYKGVDQVHTDNPDDIYKLPFEDGSVDIVVSSSCFEHDCFFWVTFLEIMRVLKPKGLFYLNAPSTGGYHCHPIDCFRYYPDAGFALEKWGKKNRMNVKLLISGTDRTESWNDYVAVFLRDIKYQDEFTRQMSV